MPTLYTKLKARYGPPARKPGMAGGPSGFAVHRSPLLSERFARPAGPPTQKRVVIVGAGFAGLAAAYELFHVGYDVIVLEARKRLGGRVFSLNDVVPDKNVEGGGELIGSNHPTWLGYKEQFGLEFLNVHDGSHSPFVFDEHVLTETESKKLSDEMDEATEEINVDARKLVNAFKPWEQPNALDLDSMPLAARIEKLNVSSTCKLALRSQLENDNGVSAEKQSYLGILAMVNGGGNDHYWTETEVYRCKGGNQQLATHLAKPFDDKHLRVGTPVRKIMVREFGISVLLESGETISADDVVLATPPSVWNRIHVEVAGDRGLPEIFRSIPQMGSNVKFLMSLSGEFWRNTDVSPDMSADRPIGDTWWATEGQPGRGDALVAFSGASGSDQCREWMPLHRPANYIKALSGVYKTLEASFVEGRFMNWPSEEWTNASYSFPAPGQVTTCGPALFDGFMERLHFAGEHTCYAFTGYMEGALHSGSDIAKRLARRDGVHNNPELY